MPFKLGIKRQCLGHVPVSCLVESDDGHDLHFIICCLVANTFFHFL